MSPWCPLGVGAGAGLLLHLVLLLNPLGLIQIEDQQPPPHGASWLPPPPGPLGLDVVDDDLLKPGTSP